MNKMNEIKKARTAAKMTQAQAAQALGITEKYYRLIESKKSVPNVYLAIKMSKLFGVSIKYLFPLEDHKKHR